MSVKTKQVTDVTIRLAGDSGDGMQLTGTQFTETVANARLDLVTLPDYPAEIRAPAGTPAGVSSYQIHFGSTDIYTPGETPDVLVAMNPAALKVNMDKISRDTILIINKDAFDQKNLKLAGYESNPLEDGSLEGYQIYEVPLTSQTNYAVEGLGLTPKEANRCKNFFALGILYWMFNRNIDNTIYWIEQKFAKNEKIKQANINALKGGYNYAENNEIFNVRYDIKSADLPKGIYKNLSGNEATALGLVTAAAKAGLELFLGSYPITPASEILHALSSYKNYRVKAIQAEDEIAGISTAIGAAFAGALAVTTTSGPGLSLKSEAIGLAVMTELPLVIVDVQRGGPSTGLPTKTEQADLLFAAYGRHGEAPVPILAAKSPADCFHMAYEAARIALKYMTPVILLTDGYLANGSEPLRIPEINSLKQIITKKTTLNDNFQPYSRDENGARPWAIPGTPGLEHRIGGLEKQNITGAVSYDGENHELMVKLRAKKIKNIANDIPQLEVEGENKGELLVLGWGSTHGTITEAVRNVREKGFKVSQAHLNYLIPFPANLVEVINNFNKVLIPEINTGQLAKLLKAETNINPDKILKLNRVKGTPLKVSTIEKEILKILGDM
ncbi:MAG TPA: 2-oxoacid:acceptor oxidoreductase subunit alpha [Ignavibacteriales bacterium]|nr:2-oxoacid:acceptor oxidoreductase subunit alpha [Ignavibacteriales bacterium]